MAEIITKIRYCTSFDVGAFGSLFGHASSLFISGTIGEHLNAVAKALAHGISRGFIDGGGNGQFDWGSFWAGTASSYLSVGNSGFIGGVAGRTLMMGLVGGTASALMGGKFETGFVSGAFVHFFNAESGKWFNLGEKVKNAYDKYSDYDDFESTNEYAKEVGKSIDATQQDAYQRGDVNTVIKMDELKSELYKISVKNELEYGGYLP